MRRARWLRKAGLALLALAGVSPQLSWSEPRIDYFEPVAIPADLSQPQINAYGHRFSLDLQPNDRLTARFATQQKPTTANFKIYRGTVRDLAGSWVRIATSGDRIEGAMWDGQDLYAITTYERIAQYSTQSPSAAPSQPVVFRLSDTHSLIPDGFCAHNPSSQVRTSALDQYKQTVGELKTTALALSLRQLEVSLIGDAAFQAQNENAAEAILMVANIVDGIFGEQVGVLIEPTDIQIVPANRDPFTSTNAEVLLTQVANFRASTPSSQARGLTYLLTGKTLDGGIAGIAYLDALCDNTRSSGLGESRGLAFIAGLVAAHEFAHVFGSPHDGEAGSACASTPDAFLMAPAIRGTSQFSECSLQEMAPTVASASCLTAGNWSDLSVTIGVPNVAPETHEPFTFPIVLSSLGTLPISNATFTANLPSHWTVSVDASGGTCTSETGRVFCSFASIAGREERRVAVTAVSSVSGSGYVSVSANAANDRFSSNNLATSDIQITPSSDATIALSAAVSPVLTDEVVEFEAQVTARLTRAIRGITVTLQSFTPLQSVTAADGSCTISGTTATCGFDSLAAGASTRILARAAGLSRAGSVEVLASVSAANDTENSNNFAQASVRVDPRRDVGFQPGSTQSAIVNEWTDVVVMLHSFGVEPVNDVTTDVVLMGRGSELQSVTVDSGSCSGRSTTYTCSFGTLQPGASRAITARVRAGAPERLELRTGLLMGDQRSDNDRATQTIHVGYGHDVSVLPSLSAEGYDGVEVNTTASVRSVGLTSAHNVVASYEIPTPSRVVRAAMPGATCTLVTQQRITCTRALLNSDQAVEMTVTTISEVPGVHIGTFAVGADEDGDATNNVRQQQLTIRPFLDIGVAEIASTAALVVGQPFDVPLLVVTGRGPVQGATLEALVMGGGLSVESITWNAGACTVATHSVCQLGNLPQNTRVELIARVRAVQRGNASLDIRVRPSPDAQPANNATSIAFSIMDQSESTLHVGDSVTASAGQSFSFPVIIVTSTQDMPRFTVEISVPDLLSVVAASSSAGACTIAPLVVCTLSTTSITRSASINLTLLAAVSGTYTSAVRLIALNDISQDDNYRNVAITVLDPTPAAPPPVQSPVSGGSSGNASGGGGGGGSTSSYLLAALLLLLTTRFALLSEKVLKP